MGLSNRQLINSVKPLREISSLKLPVRISFKLAKISRQIESALKDYRKVLEDLQDEHCMRDNRGEIIVIEDKFRFKDPEAFDKALKELLDCDSDIQFEKISLNDLGDIEIKPSSLFHLEWLIDE